MKLEKSSNRYAAYYFILLLEIGHCALAHMRGYTLYSLGAFALAYHLTIK